MFTCYVSASSGVFVKIDLFRSNMGDADESVIFELGRHAVIIGLIERNTCKGNFIPFRLERLYNDAVRYCDNIHGVSVLLSHFCTPNLPLHRPLSVFHRLLARLSHFCRPHVWSEQHTNTGYNKNKLWKAWENILVPGLLVNFFLRGSSPLAEHNSKKPHCEHSSKESKKIRYE